MQCAISKECSGHKQACELLTQTAEAFGCSIVFAQAGIGKRYTFTSVQSFSGATNEDTTFRRTKYE